MPKLLLSPLSRYMNTSHEIDTHTSNIDPSVFTQLFVAPKQIKHILVLFCLGPHLAVLRDYIFAQICAQGSILHNSMLCCFDAFVLLLEI